MLNTISIKEELKKRINRAIEYIQREKSSDGLWYDFDTLAGQSSDWVSGYVLSNLSFLTDYSYPIDRSYKTLMARQRGNGGWAYNHKVPTDVDSTSWVMMSFSGLPLWRPSALIRGIKFIKDHFNERDGGFTTYSEKDSIEKFIEVDRELTVGWMSSHTCVTAVALQSLLFNKLYAKCEIILRACQYLKDTQRSDNLWNSYWWKGSAYSTFHCLKALLLANSISIKSTKKVVKEVLSRMAKEGHWLEDNNVSSSFDTSLFVRTVLLLPEATNVKAVSKSIDYLLQSQLSDGSWPSTPILRIPPPMVTNPQSFTEWKQDKLGTGVIIKDQNRIFTTATVSSALHIYGKLIF